MLTLLMNSRYKRAMANRLNGTNPHAVVPSGGNTQKKLLAAMFIVMGKIAKMDGRVTKDEVKYASIIMQQMGLRSLERQQAINYFDQGKRSDTDIMSSVMNLARVIGKKSELARVFLLIQIKNAFVKGEFRLKERMLLRDVAELLGFDKFTFQCLCNEMPGFMHSKRKSTRNFSHNAYKVLQLEPDAEDGEIRRAYLRMMTRHHPDKLVRDNLSEETLKEAQEKSMAIRAAYEAVCGFRKIRA
ncbi:MAG: co-chaperone DjlA [Gammaproteobacteria bacterium]|nr:co-chaperone DjlA [Gammaproteobacteria bacterium]|tara:strand:+ start:579 stop:1307 length:729 start_codon:yes stop_codon:yes gene_type:complete